MSGAPYSIRRRLTQLALVVVACAMVLTGLGLTWVFQRHIERRVGQELDAHLAQIVGGLRLERDGSVRLARELADPRFGKVFGGLYFQVTTDAGAVVLKSRSLWDQTLDLPDDRLEPGKVHVHRRPGPEGSALLLHESRVAFADLAGAPAYRITVAIDDAEIATLRRGFSANLVAALALLAVVLLVGVTLQIALGLRPMHMLRQQVADVRSGAVGRLATDVPWEVLPLVEEVNSLLDQHERNMIRAHDRAADLAHGLRTPLSALVADIAQLRRKGESAIADDLQDISARMLRHLDREMARARLRHGRGRAATDARGAIGSLARMMARTPDGARLTYHNAIPDGVLLAIDQVDFLEVAGNLLENASRHAAREVLISLAHRDAMAWISVTDDGPGVPDTLIAQILERGIRLDESGQGSGLGLAIAKDILDANDGRLVLENHPDGGLCAQFAVPLVAAPLATNNGAPATKAPTRPGRAASAPERRP